MPALPPKADTCSALGYVRFVLIADIAQNYSDRGCLRLERWLSGGGVRADRRSRRTSRSSPSQRRAASRFCWRLCSLAVRRGSARVGPRLRNVPAPISPLPASATTEPGVGAGWGKAGTALPAGALWWRLWRRQGRASRREHASGLWIRAWTAESHVRYG
jgi:hypothetical protein